MDTETKLIATVDQAKLLKSMLNDAIKTAEEGSLNWVRITLEQAKDTGPWRLIIGVLAKED